MPQFTNPPDAEIRDLLLRARVLAIVGLSPKSNRPSHQVAREMQRFGYRIIPVRPAVAGVLGEKAYADLRDVPEKIDLVDVFRAPTQVEPVVDRCIELKIPALWLQDGVVNDAAARRARAAGILVIMNRCVYRDYLSFFGAVRRADTV